ncbi:MAG: hypothetical protein ACFCVK_04545 [Acidimicrobiales bacterium]
MSAEISQRQLRNDSGRIMRALIEGKTFIITPSPRTGSRSAATPAGRLLTSGDY